MQTSLMKTIKKIEKLGIRKKIIEENIEQYYKKWEVGLNKIELIRNCQSIVNTATKLTQQSLEVRLSSVVSALLQSVSKDPYNFKVEFVPRRNTVECDLLFERDGKELSILGSCGHGRADLASLGLKVSYRELKKDLSPILLMDEPFRQLEKDSHILVAQVLKEISKELGLQIVIITHEKSLIEYADRAFETKKEGNKTSVKCVRLRDG